MAISYGCSFLAHVAALTWMHVVFNSLPEAWVVENGRASVQLNASMDSRAEPSESEPIENTAVELQLPTSEPDEPQPVTKQVRSPAEGAKQQKLEQKKPEDAPEQVKPMLRRKEQVEEVSLASPEPVRREEREPVEEVAMIDATASPYSQAVEGADDEELPVSWQNNIAPRYPSAELAAGIEGTVMLIVRVNAQGTVDNVWLETSSGSVALDTAAAEAVRKWRFNPALRNGVAVAYEIRKPVKFAIGR